MIWFYNSLCENTSEPLASCFCLIRFNYSLCQNPIAFQTFLETKLSYSDYKFRSRNLQLVPRSTVSYHQLQRHVPSLHSIFLSHSISIYMSSSHHATPVHTAQKKSHYMWKWFNKTNSGFIMQ